MASAPRSRAGNTAEYQSARLAELVAGLTGCEATGALHAVREHRDSYDALEIVARAMVEVDQPPPEGFRVAGFLRDGAPEPMIEVVPLVQHGSLRRWDRLHDEIDRPEDQLATIDLRSNDLT